MKQGVKKDSEYFILMIAHCYSPCTICMHCTALSSISVGSIPGWTLTHHLPLRKTEAGKTSFDCSYTRPFISTMKCTSDTPLILYNRPEAQQICIINTIAISTGLARFTVLTKIYYRSYTFPIDCKVIKHTSPYKLNTSHSIQYMVYFELVTFYFLKK